MFRIKNKHNLSHQLDIFTKEVIKVFCPKSCIHLKLFFATYFWECPSNYVFTWEQLSKFLILPDSRLKKKLIQSFSESYSQLCAHSLLFLLFPFQATPLSWQPLPTYSRNTKLFWIRWIAKAAIDSRIETNLEKFSLPQQYPHTQCPLVRNIRHKKELIFHESISNRLI